MLAPPETPMKPLVPRAALKLLLAAGLAAYGMGRAQEPAASAGQEPWSGWAAELLLSDDAPSTYAPNAVAEGRVVVWCSKRSKASRLTRAAERSLAAFDALVPPSTREKEAPPAHAAVLFELANRESLESLTAYLGKRYESLAGWAPAAARGVGFALEEPLSAGWLLEVPENEVWSPENELVNRLARLLTLERFGRLPHWLEMGLAWHVELVVCKDVYCFPFRAGFVSKKEHKSWDARLAAAMAARGASPIGVEELSGWARGTWDEQRAPFAWGAAAMLARHYAAELPALLATYAGERRQHGRITHADGSWEALPDYELAPERERELLDAILGVDFAAELTRFARAPRSYRRSR
jgi:hypothetical protein